MLSDADSRLTLLYTRWHDGLEIIESRTAPLGTLDFGAPEPFIVLLGEDVRLTDVTGTKQSLPASTLVAVAHEAGRAWWNGWGDGISPGRSRTTHAALQVERVASTPDAFLALSFDDGRGSVTADASPEHQRATLGGPWGDDMSEPEWVPGVSGSALRFDGVRQFVMVEDQPSLTPAGSFTVEAWVRLFRQWENSVILCKGAPGERTYQLRLDSNNRVSFLRDVDGDDSKHRVRSKATVEDSLWHHVACVVDLERQESRIYLDGVRIAASPDSGSTTQTASPLFVGAREYKDRLREWWSGDIDQLRLSDGARYDADFVPPERFQEEGAVVLLSWAPRITDPASPRTYEVLRRQGETAFESLASGPITTAQLVDLPQRGHVTYRVRPIGSAWPAPADQMIDWLPSTAPPVPAPHDSSSVTHR